MEWWVRHCRAPLRAHCYFQPIDQTINVQSLIRSQKRAVYTNEKLRPMATILRPVLKKFLADMYKMLLMLDADRFGSYLKANL